MAERLEVKEAKLEEEAGRNTAREEQVRKLEQVFNAHRKEVIEMEKSLDKDLQGMRPRRLEILKRAKTSLDAVAETAKADYAAAGVEKVLRTCDENGLKVLDVLVKQVSPDSRMVGLELISLKGCRKVDAQCSRCSSRRSQGLHRSTTRKSRNNAQSLRKSDSATSSTYRGFHSPTTCCQHRS